jgi:hypothetical protein
VQQLFVEHVRGVELGGRASEEIDRRPTV